MSTSKPNPRRRNGAARTRIRQRLIARADGQPICPLCGQPIDLTIKSPDPMSCEIDEILPVSKGGDPFDLRNCQLAHRICNQRKSNRTIIRLATRQRPLPHSRQW